MAPKGWRPPLLVLPLGVLAAACVATLVLPFRMIEPDDDDYFYGMIAFARGKLVMTAQEVAALREVRLPDPEKDRGGPNHSPGRFRAMAVRSPKGFIRERSPGHYALLALFHLGGLDRYANVVLAFVVLGFFYYLVRCHLGESGEVAVTASLLLVLNPTFLTMLYRVYMSDFDYFVWATVSLGLYLVARRSGRLVVCGAAGLALSLSVFFRNTNAVAFLVIGAYELVGWLFGRSVREAAADQPRRFGWKQIAVLVVSVAVGLVPLAWYGWVTTGQVFGQGYQYRFGRENLAYFALWDARAVFSLRHLFQGEQRGMMAQGYTLSVGLARLLLGYPLVVVAPAGLVAMARRRVRPALFFGLWLGLFWGIYLCYRTIRADSFQFMCRKLSPALAPLALGAAVALRDLPRRARRALFATIVFFSLGVTAEFFVQFLLERLGPRGRPGVGRRAAPPKVPPEVLLDGALEDLGRGDAGGAATRVRRVAEILLRLPAPLRQATRHLAARAKSLDDALREAARQGKPLSDQQRAALARRLRALRRELLDALPPPPGGPPPGQPPPFGPGRPGPTRRPPPRPREWPRDF